MNDAWFATIIILSGIFLIGFGLGVITIILLKNDLE